VLALCAARRFGTLELYATEGLNPNAVHLAPADGWARALSALIAQSARPLNLSNAQSNTRRFAYKPETGEEIYNSFLGVPVLRAGRTLGVLVVQNKTMRHYRDDEVEALETTAMVIAEMIASGDIGRLSRPGLELDMRRPFSFTGLSFNDGVGLGHVVLHEPRIVVTNLFNEDSDEELRRLEVARLAAPPPSTTCWSAATSPSRASTARCSKPTGCSPTTEAGCAGCEEAIRNGLTAEAAVEKVQSDMRARMLHMTDPYLRERMSDFDDLANRLLRQLMGRGPEDDRQASLPKDAIIVARSMGAAELLDYPRDKLRGLVLEDGAPTSHVVIVARAMGIPVAGQMKGAVSMSENGDPIIVDGVEGTVHLRPQPDLEAAYAEKVRFRARRQELYRELRKKPSETKDGVKVDLLMNAGLAVDLPQLAEAGLPASACSAPSCNSWSPRPFPRAEAQEKLYRDVLDIARGKSRHLPHHRHRRRQGAALFQGLGAGREPGPWLARDPPHARPARPVAHPDPRAAQGQPAGAS
jgi:phosphotransferase system enzyme I (PtsP)